MTVNQMQFEFTIMQARLVLFAKECGFNLSLREVWREGRRQLELFNAGLSKTMNSQHLKSLAADFVMFRDGDPVEAGDDPDWLTLGEYWEHLGGTWGGRWDMSSAPGQQPDAGHFEYGE